NNAWQATGHGFNHDASAKLTDRGEQEHVGLAHLVCDFSLAEAADEFDAVLQSVLGDNPFQTLLLRTRADDAEPMFPQLRPFNEGANREFRQFVRHQTASIEKRQPLAAAPRLVEERCRIVADLRNVEDLVPNAVAQARNRVREGGQDGRRIAIGRTDERKDPVDRLDLAEHLPFALQLGGELLWPRKIAVERPDDERRT